jgi:4-hydroxybenzoate polyprenyltransferase
MGFRRRELVLLMFVLLLFIGVLSLLFNGYRLIASVIDVTHHEHQEQCRSITKINSLAVVSFW